ncbi:hypothetical protein MPSI1_003667 [Malassezia psittaci]|uniref:NADH dehydrogenase [ubiquinone] 1 alpha subcomplex subunit n=1 Tax=Malassezia psittaci TaxID=1821823 RepID=A0AAF0F847_9BASI|nr:hypothetical protein MPSI1_003667 [Malassezia psittaci]
MSIARTVDFIRKGGLAKYWRDMQYIDDAKWGTMVGIDSNGNKYWENINEQPGRTRWVDYASRDPDTTQLEPIWHAWLTNMRKDAPSQDRSVQRFLQPWEAPALENFTGTRGSFRTYNTTKPKLYNWEPKIAQRSGP